MRRFPRTWGGGRKPSKGGRNQKKIFVYLSLLRYPKTCLSPKSGQTEHGKALIRGGGGRPRFRPAREPARTRDHSSHAHPRNAPAQPPSVGTRLKVSQKTMNRAQCFAPGDTVVKLVTLIVKLRPPRNSPQAVKVEEACAVLASTRHCREA